jgi:cell division septal protein FtsQ
MSLSSKISSKLIILRRFFFLSIYLGIFLFGIWGVYKVSVGPYFRIWSIDITGNKTISGQALHHLSDIYYGQHVWSWDEEKSAAKIEEHPWIHSARVVWDFPSQVHITVEEEETRALLALNKLWYINKDGIPFHIAQSDNLNHPIITGIPQEWVEEHPYVVQRIIKESLVVLDAMDEFEYISMRQISEIYFQKDLGFSIILRNGSKIIFGFYNPKDRLKRLSQMIENGLSLNEPQQIVLDAERVAVVIPLEQEINLNQ